MIRPGVDGGGCGRKLGPSELRALIARACGDGADDILFTDSVLIPSALGSGNLVTSVDLLYGFGPSADDFGYITGLHALSDIYATLSDPLVGMLALGLPLEMVEGADGPEVIAGMQQALADEGAAFGGGHTVYADSLFAAVSVVGTAGKTRPVSLGPGPYEIVISKPVGIGIYLSAFRNSLLLDDEWSEVRAVMRESNRQAAADLRALLAHDGASVATVTDITGFGLLHTLLRCIPRGRRAEVLPKSIPQLSGVQRILSTGCVSSLGEKNMNSLPLSNAVDIGGVHADLVALMCDPQTSGGLLALVAPAALQELSPRRWTAIGSVMSGPAECEPSIVFSEEQP
jgi:selenide,water dikinase